MITENEKELLVEYFDKYKSFFVTEYDAAEKKLYLRIWIDDDGIWFQQDFFSAKHKIPYKDIQIVTLIGQNRLAIRCQYKPFPDKTIHIEGFEEPLCDPSDKDCTMTNFQNIESEIRTNEKLIQDRFFNKSENSVYYIYDLFRLGKIDIGSLEKYRCNKRWLNGIHKHKYNENTKTLYARRNITTNEKFYGLWDYLNQTKLSEKFF